MIIKPLGKIAVAANGARVQVSSSPVMACRVHFQAITGGTGKVCIGESNVDLGSYAGAIHLFWPTGVGGGQPAEFDLIDESSTGNSIDLSEIYLTAQYASEGCLVTYFQR